MLSPPFLAAVVVPPPWMTVISGRASWWSCVSYDSPIVQGIGGIAERIGGIAQRRIELIPVERGASDLIGLGIGLMPIPPDTFMMRVIIYRPSKAGHLARLDGWRYRWNTWFAWRLPPSAWQQSPP
jgi:hypothetical protein